MLEPLYCDFETYSECNLKTHSLYRYAEHPSTEILLFTYAFAEGDVVYLDVANDPAAREDTISLLSNPKYQTVWHNSAFDRTVLRHALGVDLPMRRVFDTQTQAYAHGLQGGLGALCDVFKLSSDVAKDKRGVKLIQLFCVPNKDGTRNTKSTHPIQWDEFIEYAKSDIYAMRTLHKKIPKWNMTDFEEDLWALDQEINDRGVAIDVELAAAAIDITKRLQDELKVQVFDMTDGEVQAATQRDAMLAHILKEYGVSLKDMTAATLQTRINDPELPEGLKELLALRLQASTTSTSKFKRLLNVTSRDSRLRGSLQFCGASRTGRWSGRNFQPQNLPRPSHKQKDIDAGILAIKTDCLEFFTDTPLKLISSTIRGVLVAPTGKKLVVSDLSNIEGRVAAWLAGEEWKLQAFRDYDAGVGEDLYVLAYAKAFNVTPASVLADRKTGGVQRQVGKVLELSMGYGGGVSAFLTFALGMNLDLDKLAEDAYPTIPFDVLREAEDFHAWAVKNKRTLGLDYRTFVVCESLKRLWRRAHPAITNSWRKEWPRNATRQEQTGVAGLEHAALLALHAPGTPFTAAKITFLRKKMWLRAILPSGRSVCYPVPSEVDGALQYFGVNQYSRQWGPIKTWGGKLLENVTQAVARDVLAANMRTINDAGYKIVLTVHDELITETEDDHAFTAEKLSDFMATPPVWAADLPLASAGFETYRYKKGD